MYKYIGHFILKNTPAPWGEEISAEVVWERKYEKGKRKSRKM
jgi:hypothetical protein